MINHFTKMDRTCNVLIIEDHQIIIDTYKKALTVVQKGLENILFETDEAKDCASAFQKIKNGLNLESIDLFFLDINLPSFTTDKLFSGEDLGVKIKKNYPNSKIIVCTSFDDNLRLSNIIKKVDPDSLLVKSDIEFNDIVEAIKKVLDNQIYYSKTVINLLRKKATNSISLSYYDIQILHEISNGAKMNDLLQLIPLSKSGIEKRKRHLKIAFDLKEDNDRDLILAAKDKGFI